jgi:hypothetical protein
MELDLAELIQHPERLDKNTLFELRSLLAVYPYYQTARLLMLQNLYLLHDISFDEELRRAAIYITDRRVIFNLVEAAHYKHPTATKSRKQPDNDTEEGNRTITLIDNFLQSIPKEEDEEKEPEKKRRAPTPADAAIDYVSYLLQTESEEEKESSAKTPLMKGQNLIDNFIENDKGKIQLKEVPEYFPQDIDNENNEEKEGDESFFTETLAKIYIKQGRYSKALEIIQRLSLNYPKKNAYFADQIRFLEKLIINNKNK